MRIRSTLIRLLISIAVSGLILAFLMRLVSGAGDGTEHTRLIDVLRRAAPGLMALYAVCAVAQGLVRAWRYRLLLAGGGERNLPGFPHLYLVTQTRNMLVDLLPGRAGELGYVLMLNQGYRVGADACFSSMGLSFLFDLLALLLILGAVLLNAMLVSAGGAPLLYSFLTLAVAVALAFLVAFRGLRLVAKVAARLLPPKAGRLPSRAVVFLVRLADAVDATRRARILGRVLSLSVLVRGIKYAGLTCAFRAVAGPSFPALAGLPAGALLAALIGAEAASALPIPAFMSFGTYEAGGALVLTMFGASAAVSSLVILSLHICTQIVDYVLGGLALCGFVLLARRKQDKPC
jgi:uncharacterized membrane protein YbhN (UPF0104 family)